MSRLDVIFHGNHTVPWQADHVERRKRIDQSIEKVFERENLNGRWSMRSTTSKQESNEENTIPISLDNKTRIGHRDKVCSVPSDSDAFGEREKLSTIDEFLSKKFALAWRDRCCSSRGTITGQRELVSQLVLWTDNGERSDQIRMRRSNEIDSKLVTSIIMVGKSNEFFCLEGIDRHTVI